MHCKIHVLFVKKLFFMEAVLGLRVGYGIIQVYYLNIYSKGMYCTGSFMQFDQYLGIGL